MKRLATILTLVCILICSCTPAAPPAESPAESSTEATTTAATTAATTEVEEIEKFQPTKDNVIWGEYARNGGSYDPGVFARFAGAGITGTFLDDPCPMGITVSSDLEEILESAKEDDRLAVMFLSVYNGDEGSPTEGQIVFPFDEENTDTVDEGSEEYDNYINPFSQFSEDYTKQYIMIHNIANFAFMTPEEVSKLVINKNTGLILDLMSYESFLYWMGYSDGEIEAMVGEES